MSYFIILPKHVFRFIGVCIMIGVTFKFIDFIDKSVYFVNLCYETLNM